MEWGRAGGVEILTCLALWAEISPPGDSEDLNN